MNASKPSRRSASGRGCRGFTLVELMIVVVIVGILASVAYPSYQNHVQSTRRSDAHSALHDAAQRLERCFTRFNSYAAGAGCDFATTLAGGVDSPEGWYEITENDAAAATFELVAAPQGAQADDMCGDLTLDERGVRGSGGSVDECW